MTTTLLTNGKSGGATSFNTASITPSARKLLLAVVMSDLASGAANEPTMSGNNLTWVKVTTQQNTVENHQRITMFRAMGASPTAGVATIDFGGQTTTSVFWGIVQFDTADQSNANGAGAIVQSATQSANTTDPLNMTVTLSAFSNVNNVAFAAMIGPDAPAVSSGFTAVFTDIQDLGPDNNVGVYFKNGSATSINFTATGSGANVSTALACEIKYGQGFQGAMI